MREETLRFESDPKPRDFASRFPALVMLAPAAWLLGFWSLVLRARLVAGEWPAGRSGNFFEGTMVPETIDPQALGVQSTVVTLGMLGLVYVVPTVLFFVILGRFLPRLRQPPWLILAFLVSSGLAAATLFLDPGGYITWFMD